jgi:hypothetical protein
LFHLIGKEVQSCQNWSNNRLTEWLTCRRDTRDAMIIVARYFADFGRRTYAEGGQVQPVLGGSIFCPKLDREELLARVEEISNFKEGPPKDWQ